MLNGYCCNLGVGCGWGGAPRPAGALFDRKLAVTP